MVHSSFLNTKGELVQFDITGEPVAQRRPRVAFKCRQIYNPQSNDIKNLQQDFREALEMLGQDNTKPLFETTKRLTLSISFSMGKDNKDIDNMVKYYMDAMHQVVYANDKKLIGW